ncbi:SMC family ATPase [Cyanobium sp. FGCU-6]|nr:SMC family ATPase [Cyanobium sp. FGCU6]
MKPHLLRIEAFGPYAEPTAISFDALSPEGLFLIHGSTGAGKTFLLDALCFALYGEVSGDRNLKGLKSDHAAAGALPQVVLEFSCGGVRYRVERSPAHSAPRARGSGTVERAAQAALFRLGGGERQTIASRTSEVNQEVERLVGLNAAQFRQVILLPQGRFAAVLRAGGEEREALLKTLFDTVLFEQASSWLEERDRAARIELAERNRALEVLRRQAAHEWSAHAPAAPDPSAESASGALPETQEDLDRLCERIAAVVAMTAADLERRSAALEVARQARAVCDSLAERWDRRAAASARLAERESQRASVEEFRQRLQRAERAEALRASAAEEDSARYDLESLKGTIAEQLRQAVRARERARALPPSVRLLPLQALPSLDDLTAASNDLAARRAEVQALCQQAQEAQQAAVRAVEAGRRAQVAEGDQGRAAAALEQRQRQRLADAEALQRACSARDRLSGLQRAAEEAGERARSAMAVAPARQRLSTAEAGRNRADAERNRALAALLDLRQAQIAGMAARLAQGLRRGDPCPVCGALEHPRPAHSDREPVGEERIKSAEAAVEAATGAARAAATALATAEAELKALLEKAGEAAGDPAAAVEGARQAAADRTAAQEAAVAIEALEAVLSDHDRHLQSLQAAVQAAGTERALQLRAAADEEQRAAVLRAGIARELGEEVEPAAVLEAFGPLQSGLRALASSAAEWSRGTSRLERAMERLASELAGTGFADGAAVLAALVEEGRRRHWAERIAGYEREVIELRGALAAPELAALPEERPDTAAAAAAQATADAARTLATRADTQARGAQGEIERLAAEHRQGAAALAQERQRAQRLQAVADRCSGRSAPHISLQRWVLSTYLGEICGFANQRLELMTAGRYQLRLTDAGGRGGRQAGLGLRVLDAYTGEEREVNSLSGGETFQASLALALGVADTVQAHAGGVHLEALFIDEGFGTLDPDNLQLAMDELDRLREGGRLIGIISHVGALRERIRAGIEVSASERGSVAVVRATVMD